MDPDTFDPQPVEAGRTVGRYTLRYRVAAGGMASVYLAQYRSGGSFLKWVAIKLIHPHLAAERQFIAMFLSEARLAIRLSALPRSLILHGASDRLAEGSAPRVPLM